MQYLGVKQAPGALFGTTGRVPTGSIMSEVNFQRQNAEGRSQQERAREAHSNLPRPPLHLNILQQAPVHHTAGMGVLASDIMEVAVILFTRPRGMNASRKPFTLRHPFNLNENIQDWESYLRDLALTHPAWVERNPDEGMEFDASRGIWIGEVSLRSRNHEPAVRPISKGITGSIRQLLHYAFLREMNDGPFGLNTNGRPVSKKPTLGLRALALSIPVFYKESDDLDIPPLRVCSLLV